MAAPVLNLMWEGIETRGGSVKGGRGDSVSEGRTEAKVEAAPLPTLAAQP